MRIINYYMEHSKNKILLCLILGVMELMNAPLNVLFLLFPIGAYIFALRNRNKLMLPFIPAAIQPTYELYINILLITLFALLLLAVITSVGRRVHNEETELFNEALRNSQMYHEGYLKLYLIYKRKRNGITIRRIYTHIEIDKWNERKSAVLQKFNAHFVDAGFQYFQGNSRIIVMRTADGIEKPIKAKWHDDELERDLEEL